MRVAAYGISRNEEPNVESWLWGTRECAERVVVDTGSTDGTVTLLRRAGVTVVERRWDPFRFDEPRNLAMSLVGGDADWLASPDFDEQFADGWIASLAELSGARPDATRITYRIVFPGPDGGTRSGEELGGKIHKQGYRWIHPVHEILSFEGDGESVVHHPGIVNLHRQDPGKEREEYYLALALRHLEREPESAWLHWFALRGFAHVRRDPAKCIEHAEKYLSLTKPYTDFRAIALAEVGRAILETGGNPQEAVQPLLRAVGEDPTLKTAWYWLGESAARCRRWELALFSFARLAELGVSEAEQLRNEALKALQQRDREST
jgi:glycosyltransferase involved in cell wall biosynthesis